MRAGRLDRTLIIQRATTTQNSVGEPVQSWSTLVTVPAGIAPSKGSERFQAQQLIGKAIQTFRIRYRTGLRVTDRISFDGRLWDIHDIREVGRREGLEIDASARSDT